jgi:hypothetical protein
MPRRLLILTLLLALLWPAASAGAERIQPIRPASHPSGGAAPFFRDRVIDGPPRAGAAAFSGATTRSYQTSDGTPIEVTMSRSVSGDAQSYVDFLSSRLHGDELTLLRVFIGTEAEVNDACGGGTGVLACYARDQRRVYIPDRDPASGGPFTRDYAITHEYGHHIASYRSDFPWLALNWGPKYWASYAHVCAQVDRGALYPGNQGAHYLDDPGEGFADSYAHLHYPDVLWQFNPIMRPDAGAFAAIRRDVLDPWRVPRRRTLTGRLGGGRRVASLSLTGTLDGQLATRLRSSRGARFDLELRSHGRLLKRVSGGAGTKHADALVCRNLTARTASATVRAVRRAGSGPFTLTVDYPG